MLPERPQLGLAEGRQPVGGVGVDAGGDDLALVPLDQFGHPVERAGAVGEEQAGALELAPADLQAVLQVAVVVLVGLGVDDHGVVHAGLGHAPQQVLGGGGLVGLVRPLGVVGEAGVVLAGEAVEVGVDDRGTPVVGPSPVPARCERHRRGGGGLEEMASSHGGLLPDGCVIEPGSRRPAQGITRAGAGHRRGLHGTERK